MQIFKKENELTPCRFKEGFYVVPKYRRFSVNKEGDVFDRKFEVIAKKYPRKSESGKIYLQIIGNLAIHRLMAETFLDDSHLPDTEISIVNHIDGNTENNHISNLEWSTYQENAYHAYSTGLRTDNIPLLCKDLRTNEIIRFFSYWDCARYFKINGGNVFHYLKSKLKNKIFMKHYLLIKEGDEWPEVNSDYINEIRQGDGKVTVVVAKLLKQIHIFESVTEASKFVNIKPGTLMQRLRVCESKNKDFIEDENYKITYMKNFLKIIEKDLEQIKHEKQKLSNRFKLRQPKRIKVLDLKNNVEQEWESAQKFAESINTTKNTLQKHINRNNGVFYNRYKITYLS